MADLGTRLDRLESLVVALADLHASTLAIPHPDPHIRGLEETIERLGREIRADRTRKA